MIQRGRRSAASLSVVRAEPRFKPRPPPDLTPPQAAEWRKVVNRLPADWFPAETHACLAAYCRHHANAQRLAGLVDTFNMDALRDPAGPGLKVYDKLLAAHQRETAAMSSLATRLRITPQSRMRAETAARYGRVVDVDVSALWGGDETIGVAQVEGPEEAP